MAKKKLIPEADLIEKDISYRLMRLPPDVKLAKPAMLRWFALSTGLISPDETRQTAFQVLDALFNTVFTQKFKPTTKDLKEYIIVNYPTNAKISEKLIRYHINKLITMGLVIRNANRYSFAHPSHGQTGDHGALFEEIISKNMGEIVDRNRRGFDTLVKFYRR